MTQESETQDVWSGRVGFILATIGSAVGIGSIWKFPYEVGANGGGVFVLFYALGLIFIVVPLMFAEFAIGRRGRGDPASSIAAVAAAYHASAAWRWAGVLGVATGFLILSFYCVIGGWAVGYAAETAFKGLSGSDPQAVHARYKAFLAAPLHMLTYDTVFIAATTWVVARGIGRGIEAASKVLMPLLGILMLGLAAYSTVEGDVGATVRFLFTFDWTQMNARAALEAIGLGFFSIGVGLGLMITYAAYSDVRINLKEVAIVSVVADSLISLLAGFAVFPIVFAYHLDAAAGPGLVFITLPIAFANMPFGVFAAIAFFVLLIVAALASAISMFELTVALLMRRWRWKRLSACVLVAVACLGAGVPTVLSFNYWAEWFPMAFIAGLERATYFDLLDQLTSNVLLPLGSLAIAVFAAWVVPQRLLIAELELTPFGATLLRGLLRYVVPVMIAVAALAPVLL